MTPELGVDLICRECRFWWGHQCHRYPPAPQFGCAEAVFPTTDWEDACGEYAEKERP